MRVRARLDRLRQALGGLPPPGQLDLIVAVPVGSGKADDLPPGLYFNADGRVATVVFEGAGPDQAVVAGLEAQLATPGLVVGTHPRLSGCPRRAAPDVWGSSGMPVAALMDSPVLSVQTVEERVGASRFRVTLTNTDTPGRDALGVRVSALYPVVFSRSAIPGGVAGLMLAHPREICRMTGRGAWRGKKPRGLGVDGDPVVDSSTRRSPPRRETLPPNSRHFWLLGAGNR